MRINADAYGDRDKGENGNDDDEKDVNSNHALANTTIESLESTTSTKPEHSAEEIVPDFAIIRIKYGVRNMELKKTWDNVKIRHAGIPLLAENKRSGKRSLPNVLFLKSTTTFISRAQRDLFRQAAYLFTMHPRQQSVVLVACSGIYWSCMIADREYVLDRVISEASDDFIAVDDKGSDEETSDEDDGEGGWVAEEEMIEEDVDELDLINEPSDSQAQSSSPRSDENEET
jgi:hypothetical protein